MASFAAVNEKYSKLEYSDNVSINEEVNTEGTAEAPNTLTVEEAPQESAPETSPEAPEGQSVAQTTNAQPPPQTPSRRLLVTPHRTLTQSGGSAHCGTSRMPT